MEKLTRPDIKDFFIEAKNDFNYQAFSAAWKPYHDQDRKILVESLNRAEKTIRKLYSAVFPSSDIEKSDYIKHIQEAIGE